MIKERRRSKETKARRRGLRKPTEDGESFGPLGKNICCVPEFIRPLIDKKKNKSYYFKSQEQDYKQSKATT